MITHDFIIISSNSRTVKTTKIRNIVDLYYHVDAHFRDLFGCWALDIDTGVRYKIDFDFPKTLLQAINNESAGEGN